MGFPISVREEALIKCKRHCVLCEKSKGIKVECHHIKPKAQGGEDTLDNCIPVCFDCHAEVGGYNTKHPKGNKYTESELKIRRDNFYNRVENGEFPTGNYMKNESDNSLKDCDKSLYEYIKNVFGSPNLKYYLTEVDLGNDFNNEIFNPLSELYYLSNDPNYSFVDNELDKAMNNLVNSISTFLSYKAINTFPTNFGTQAVQTCKNCDYTQQESMRIIREFNDLATDIWSNYCILVKMFRER